MISKWFLRHCGICEHSGNLSFFNCLGIKPTTIRNDSGDFFASYLLKANNFMLWDKMVVLNQTMQRSFQNMAAHLVFPQQVLGPPNSIQRLPNSTHSLNSMFLLVLCGQRAHGGFMTMSYNIHYSCVPYFVFHFSSSFLQVHNHKERCLPLDFYLCFLKLANIIDS